MKNVSTKLAVATVVAGAAVAAGSNGTVVHAEELATPVMETTTQTQDAAPTELAPADMGGLVDSIAE